MPRKSKVVFLLLQELIISFCFIFRPRQEFTVKFGPRPLPVHRAPVTPQLPLNHRGQRRAVMVQMKIYLKPVQGKTYSCITLTNKTNMPTSKISQSISQSINQKPFSVSLLCPYFYYLLYI